MMLMPADAAAVQAVQATATEELLDPVGRPPNVVGVAAGVKWTDGEPTGEPALLVLVTHKVPEDELPSASRVPRRMRDMQTDVMAIGYPIAGGGLPLASGPQMQLRADGLALHVGESAPPIVVAPQTLARRIRPAEGGYSVGHVNITAGTIATCVYDFLPGASTNPPAPGVGNPPRYYILSNNHVLANSNNGMPGDPILQPGPFDGGTNPADRIASLSRFIPITFDPPTPVAQHRNLVDAAVAEGEFHDLDREIFWTGYVRGWRRKANVPVGLVVQKSGRTTNYTVGRVTAINATVDVGFGGGRVARFVDQIITTNMSAGGDSGSLVTTLDDVAVGLLFAGSEAATILNQIENVRALLRVEVAEQIL
jgi:hypothetical protein